MPVLRTKWSSFLTRKPLPLVKNGKSLPKTFSHPKAKRAKRLRSIPEPRHGHNIRTRSQCSNQTDVSAAKFKPQSFLLSCPSHPNLNWFQSGDKAGHATGRWCPNIPTFSIPFPSLVPQYSLPSFVDTLRTQQSSLIHTTQPVVYSLYFP